MATSHAICVDFDGVIAHYTGFKGVEHIGEPIDGAREFLKRHYKLGRRIIIYTARLWPFDARGKPRKATVARRFIVEWLETHRMPYHELHAKPIAAAYVDDRAVEVPTNPVPGRLAYASAVIDQLLDDEK